ncbi:hypothetical protein [Aeromonas diversa]|uniref:hypothetical protein n=1 Tax=Aeromonas diversa TaxID=502790 RepID=UPI0034622506
MSSLDPVILNNVTKVAAAVDALAARPQGDTVLLDIPVRKGHSFAEGDLALYDTERGDLHDGRAEFEAYFSPASGGNNWVAAARQAVGFHERADGSLIVASLFRQASATETAPSAPRLEVGYRAPDGTWQYAGVSLSGNGTYQTLPVQSMRFVQISADEYFVVLTTYASSYSYYFTSVISIRIVAGAPVIGAISGANEFNHVRFNAPKIMFAIGDSELMVLIPDTSSPTAAIFKSAAGVISKTTVADAAIPKVTDVYQIDSKRILFADAATPRLGRIEAGVAVFDTVTLDTSRLTGSVSYSRPGGFTGAGYAVGTDVLPGVFAPADLGAGRVFVTSTTFGGFEVDGLTVRVFPPINGGAIGDDLIFYPAEVPATARHPLFLGGALHSGICYGAQFVRRALSAAGSVNSDQALASGYTRASIKGQYVEGGVLLIRQSGPSALAPIGTGGKVVGRQHDPALARKAAYADVAGQGLLLRPSYSDAGRDRYPGSTVYVRERTPSQDFMLPALAGPVRVSFTGIASQITTATKFWSVVDGQWSVKSVLYASGNQAPYLPGTAMAVKEAAFYWDYPSRVLSSATSGLTITVAEVSI